MSVDIKKQELRSKYRLIRHDILNRKMKNDTISSKFFEFVVSQKFKYIAESKNIIDIKNVFAYCSIDSEVNTQNIIDFYKVHGNLWVPYVFCSNMYCVNYSDYILQKFDDVLDGVNNSITIVPLIAFDNNCNRLGFGGGYYDRYLKNNHTIAIGLAYDEQFSEFIPIEVHDYALDVVITPNHIYTK